MPDVIVITSGGPMVEIYGEGESAVAIAARAAQVAAATSATAAEEAAGAASTDAESTAADALATAADRVATGQDRIATAADRVQTGLDAATATTQAGIATTQAGIATTQAGNALGSANAAASSLATAQGITGAVQGIGTGSFMAPRNAELGSAAFASVEQLTRSPLRAITANYQITADDDLCTLLIESGTVTLTLPLITALPPLWQVRIANRSGNTATVQRAATAVIGAAATSISVADGAVIELTRRDATRFERTA
jgi:hypothetical protein